MNMYCSQCDKKTEHSTSVYVADEYDDTYELSVDGTATCDVCDWSNYGGSGTVKLYYED